MYQSPGIVPAALPPMRLALCGMPGSGKTTAALTFPNPVLVDLDHKAKPGTPVVPLWDSKWVLAQNLCRQPAVGQRLRMADAFEKWLDREIRNFAPEQTLIIDSFTQVTRYWDIQIADNPHMSKDGQQDTRSEFRSMLSWGQRIINHLVSASCRVVVIFHVTRDKDEKGNYNGKYRPVAAGQFGETILGNFTHALFALCREKPGKAPEYLWQVKGDNAFDSQGTYNAEALIEGRYVPATFNSIV